MIEEVKLYRRIKKCSAIILFIVVPLTFFTFIYALTCTSYMCGGEFFIVLFLITIPGALFLRPLLFVMACYKITSRMDESVRRYIKLYLQSTVFMVIIVLAFSISVVSSPMSFLAASSILMLAWGMGKSERKDVESYYKFAVFVVIIIIALLFSFASTPTPSMVVSFISMLVWSVASVGLRIYLLIKGLKSSASKKWLIISYFMPLVGLIEFQTAK